MPTANWKTKVIKPVIEKKISSTSKLSPISKAKSTLKVLSISKTIKKKTNNTIKPVFSTSSISKVDTNKANTIVTNSTTSVKPTSHFSYTHNNSTPLASKTKMVSSSSIKDNNKDKPNNGILSRSATLPVSTPKRINKNIKRNNIAFTKENEQDINRMFISAETLKSTSIDSFFSHYNSTESEKKEFCDKKVNKKSVNYCLKKLDKKNVKNQLNSLNEGKKNIKGQYINSTQFNNTNFDSYNNNKNSNSTSNFSNSNNTNIANSINSKTSNKNDNNDIKNKISDKSHDGQKSDDTPFNSENNKSINFENTIFSNHQEIISNNDIPKENLLLTENYINDKVLGKKLENKGFLKENSLRNNLKESNDNNRNINNS